MTHSKKIYPIMILLIIISTAVVALNHKLIVANDQPKIDRRPAVFCAPDLDSVPECQDNKKILADQNK